MSERKQTFLSEVIQHIKSKEAKELVRNELNYHIKAAKKDLVKQGLSEAEAEDKSVEQMGSPIKLGQQLNKVHRPRVDWISLILLVIILGFGLLPLLHIDDFYGNLLAKKLFYSVFGIITVILLMLLNYRKLRKFGWWFYGFGVFLLLILNFSPYAINGKPFLQIFTFTIDGFTSLPFFLIAWASLFQNNKLKIWQFIGLFLLTFGLFFRVLGSSLPLIYLVMVLSMLWWSKFNRKTVIAINTISYSTVLMFGILIALFGEPYQKSRILGFLYPEQYPDGAGYQYLLIKNLLEKARWIGQSEFHSFPAAHTNLAFVSITYYFGWIAGMIIVIVLSLLVARMIAVSIQVRDPFGKLLLLGGISLISIQLVYNIAMSLGFLPIIGISLPLISYGITPTVLNAGIIGIALSVYRRKDLVSANNLN